MSLGRSQDAAAAAAAAAAAGDSDVHNVEAASCSSHTPNRSPRFRSMINLGRSSPRSREAQMEEPSAWEIVRRSRAEYEEVALALFPSLPYELQLHILSFIPIRDLTKTMSCASRYYAAMYDRYVRGSIQTIFSERASSTDKSQSRGLHHPERSSPAATSRLIFEAQRPIDTLTTKHFLHFSHLGPDDSWSDGCTGTYAHFTFVRADADASSTSKRLELDRGTQASSTAASPWRRVAPAGYPAQLSIPQVPLEHRDRLTSRDITSSVSSPPSATASVARALPDSPPRATSTQVLASSSARGMAFTDVATPYERFSAARLVSDDEDADETASVGGGGNQEEEHGSTARVVPGTGGSTWIRGANDELHPAGEDLNRPLDAYDWSGPISSSLHSPSRSPFDARQSRRSPQRTTAAMMPTYQFQLDPLDSFESWCLSLTLQRKREDVDVPGRPAMRWEKRLAEGLDRVFREWFVPASEEASGQTALARPHAIHDGVAGQSTSLEEEARAEQEEAAAATAAAAPRPRALEFDGPSCVVWIQPHAHKNLTSHPALSQAYSHSYLSNASLSSSSASSRVTLTFNASSIRINAARLLACAQDVEDDIRNAHRMASAGGARILAGSSGGSSWAHATGGSNYFANQTGVTVLALSGFR